MEYYILEDIKSKIKLLIIRSLELPYVLDDLNNDELLFGAGGLGLDSVDALTLVAKIEQEFQISILDDELTDILPMATVNTLSDYVEVKLSNRR